MSHKRRRFQIADVLTEDELAVTLRAHTWTLCTGFRFGASLWLNDSFSEDSVQEYAVVREADGAQLETITVSWCSAEELRTHASRLAVGTAVPSLLVPARVELQPHSVEPCDLCR